MQNFQQQKQETMMMTSDELLKTEQRWQKPLVISWTRFSPISTLNIYQATIDLIGALHASENQSDTGLPSLALHSSVHPIEDLLPHAKLSCSLCSTLSQVLLHHRNFSA